MRLILDTHIVLWWLGSPDKLADDARAAIASPDHVVYLSAAAVWEMRIKEALHKLHLPAAFEATLKAERFEELPISVHHAHALKRLPMLHRDPFDRLLIVQALTEDATVVTRDAVFGKYDVPVLAG